ncbi:MAG: TonB-dependent receptor family protein, partial [Betaproteobacteria bacterium]
RWRGGALACAAALAAGAAHAQADDPRATLEPVVISGAGTEQRAFDTPYAITVIDADALRAAGPMVNLSEALVQVPGLVVNNRNNYAQDLQINSRGFGARASFGVRGIRLYTDGIPASGPDGQGQVSHFDIAGASRIEVLRGPFSALYGNSSGGVISLVSAPPTTRFGEVDADVGSNGLWQVRLGAEAPLGNGFDIRAEASHFETDGVRAHAEAKRDLGNVRLGWRGELDSVTVLFNTLSMPAQDPLGLTRAQFDADPNQTITQATTFDTRKDTAQTQIGAQWKHRFSSLGALQESQLTAYTGQRSVTQWQSIPVSVQDPTNPANAGQPGGVIDFDRDYYGLDGRLIWRWQLDEQRHGQFIVGASVDQNDEDRRGFLNYVGTPPNRQLGVTGDLRRQEHNRVRTTDGYAQGEVDLTKTVAATLGVRSGRVDFRSEDQFLANGDDSGSLRFSYTNPVAALQWRALQGLNLYVSAGRGFESPTLNELAYRSDGTAGFNSTLQPQTSRQVEVGAKWRDATHGVSADLAVFRADTENEIGVASNTGGRSSFQNVGRTRRQGVELGAGWQATKTLSAQLALSWLDATYRDGFTSPSGSVPAGNRIAGTMKKSAWGELAWRPIAATTFAVEVRGQGSIPVDDLNSDFAAGVTTVALRASHSYTLPVGSLELLARVDNLTDRSYAGSVIVNEGNKRFFETAAGRTALLAARWRVPF